MKNWLGFFLLFAVAGSLFAQDAAWVRDWEKAQRERPRTLSSNSRIAREDEPGVPLVLHGRLLQADGKTPAAGALVFAYQTDAKGLYREPGQQGWRLQGWAVTDQDGKFKFSTIRPAPYPAGNVPAHLHLTVSGEGVSRQWTDEIRFADDPLISKDALERSRQEGKFGPVRPVHREGKIEHIDFDLRLKPTADF